MKRSQIVFDFRQFLKNARLLRLPLVCSVCVPVLSGCCSYFYYDCAPQQPAGITANENVAAFVSARDQAEGLLAVAGEVFTAAATTRLTPAYTTAANAANAWIDGAGAALRSGAALDAQGGRKLDDVVASIDTFADAVESTASDSANLRAQYTAPPADAVLDRLTGSPAIVAAAEQVKNGVAAGVDAIRAGQGAVASLDQTSRGHIAQTIESGKWKPASEVLSTASTALRAAR
jgi:hypothetical protein